MTLSDIEKQDAKGQPFLRISVITHQPVDLERREHVSRGTDTHTLLRERGPSATNFLGPLLALMAYSDQIWCDNKWAKVAYFFGVSHDPYLKSRPQCRPKCLGLPTCGHTVRVTTNFAWWSNHLQGRPRMLTRDLFAVASFNFLFSSAR